MSASRMAGVFALAVSLYSSSALATQIRYTVSGTGSGYLDQTNGQQIPLSNLNTVVTAVGETDTSFNDTTNSARLIPIFDAGVTFSGSFGTNSPPLAPPPAGSQRIFAVGYGPHDGVVAFGEVTGSSVDLGDGLSGPGLIGYTGLTSLAPTAVTLNGIAELSLANGNTVSLNSFSSLNFKATILGQSAADPMIPQSVTGGFTFNFNATGGVPVYVDPAIATGYDYLLGTGSPLITQAIFPVIGSSSYSIYALNDLSKPLFSNVAGGATVDFTTLAGYSGGINGFALRGIDASAGLDPANPLAFATGLTFGGSGQVNLKQVAVTSSPSAVPEPASWAMMLAGFGLAGGALRKQRRHGLPAMIGPVA